MTTDYVATKLFEGIAEGSFYIIVNPETGDMQQDLMTMYIKSRHDGIQARPSYHAGRQRQRL